MQIIPTKSAFFMQIQSFAVILVRNGSAKCGHAVTGGACRRKKLTSKDSHANQGSSFFLLFSKNQQIFGGH